MSNHQANRFEEIATGLQAIQNAGFTISDLGLDDKNLQHDLEEALSRDSLDTFLTMANAKSHHALTPLLNAIRSARELLKEEVLAVVETA